MKKYPDLRQIIKQAVDIHVHIGPEIIPRKYTVQQLVDEEKNKIDGMVLKNHFYPTSPFIKEIKNKKNIKLYGSVTLNYGIGGLNPDAILSASYMSDFPIMVWFPTISAENFLRKSTYEIAPEWVGNNTFIARKSNQVRSIRIGNKSKLSSKTIDALTMIKKCKAVLATGHISYQESIQLVNYANEIGLKNMVITHPIYQKIQMPIEIQKKLVLQGCFIEQCYSMYSIDKIPIQEIVKQIKAVGYQSVILSSDVGQTFSPSPSSALYKFGMLLLQNGITINKIYQMMVTNPNKLLSV